MSKVTVSRMDEKGRLVLPKSIREALHAEPGDLLYLRADEEGVKIVRGVNPFDALAEEAIRENRAGKTRDLREVAKEWGIDLEAPDDQG